METLNFLAHDRQGRPGTGLRHLHPRAGPLPPGQVERGQGREVLDRLRADALRLAARRDRVRPGGASAGRLRQDAGRRAGRAGEQVDRSPGLPQQVGQCADGDHLGRGDHERVPGAGLLRLLLRPGTRRSAASARRRQRRARRPTRRACAPATRSWRSTTGATWASPNLRKKIAAQLDRARSSTSRSSARDTTD